MYSTQLKSCQECARHNPIRGTGAYFRLFICRGIRETFGMGTGIGISAWFPVPLPSGHSCKQGQDQCEPEPGASLPQFLGRRVP
jgi:hypothetical protein